jgi:SAM-dependent methyltransferase
MDSLIPKSSLEKCFLAEGPNGEIPGKLQSITWKMDGYADELRCRGEVYRSWLPIKIEKLWDNIRSAESKGIISPDEKVLELGSGNGSALMTWAYKGYDVTGIEIDPVLAEYSIEALSKHKRFLKNPNVKVIEGSYYPEGYIKYRETSPENQTVALENKFVKGFDHPAGGYFFLECKQDVYAKNNISLKDFDIIYAYLWKFQMPSVIEMFKKYAKKDAKLFLLGPDAEEIAPMLGLKQHPSSYQFFTKK